ncbi:hypothetical protein [Halorubrum sp. Atlit-26R]|uniref:hypothetical protein n=1 Tax=Halorubrum sp. Atlit-26R TaxID=2282128 RepID=UPI000EF1B7F2|nr:hypothetical protein [Halorubrum sp. Atlit-26R]RLM67623.1 hypothetical protein DVK07_12755 [Halorubrum sp. Atlit-26R]
MTTRIYTIPLPEATTPTDQDALGTQLSEQGVLGSDAIVDALSSEAADLTLIGQYALGPYHSEVVATELEELADSAIGAVSLYGGAGSRSGYYQIRSADVEPVHAAGRDIWEWELSLTANGTRKSQFRAVETAPSQPDPGHPFGNGMSALVGVPSAARQVRIVDSTSDPTERIRPTPVDTVSGALGDVDRYDVADVAIDEPVLLYDVPPDAQADVDVHVYDTRGRDAKFLESEDGRVRMWQSVFARDHEFTGNVVCSNGLVRIRVDEPTAADATAALDVEAWDAGASEWMAVDLPSYADGELETQWEPVDVDLTHIGQASVRAQVEFEAVAGTNEGDVYALDVELERGRSDVEVWVPDSVAELPPPDLEALLEPAASPSIVDSGADQGLVAREEVRL